MVVRGRHKGNMLCVKGVLSDVIPLLAATKQLYEQFFPSFPSSVYPSMTPFLPCSCHRIIMKILGVIIMDKRDVPAKGQSQRPKVNATEIKTQFSRFRTVTPV